MFEKEAIRHAFEDTIGVECLIKPVEDFTYEELSDEQQEKAYDFKKGAEFGYNKANEWYYVKDGDLPKNNTTVLVILKNKRVKISTFMENKFTIWNNNYDAYTKLYDVIAWKEITPPVLPKECE